jgi:hypothetical protein
MKLNLNFTFGVLVILFALLLPSCTPITMTSWVNPKESQQVSNIVVWAMFERMEYAQPFEQVATDFLIKKGLKATQSMKILDFHKKYEKPELEKILKDAGADALLLVSYEGTEKTENYVPPTTTYYPDYYYSYYGYYSWGYPTYYGGGNVATTGGYWVTTKTVKLRANLYSVANAGLLWSADIAVEDPKYVDEATHLLMLQMYPDWQKHKLIAGQK